MKRLRILLFFTLIFLAASIPSQGAEVRQEVYLLRDHPAEKIYETLEVTYETTAVLGITTRVVRRCVHQGTPPSNLLSISGDPEEFHFSLISPDLEFVIPRYERRGWGESFPDKLRKLARDYLNDSIYVTIFDNHNNRMGAIRFIHRPYLQKRTPEGVEILDTNSELYGPTKGMHAAGEKSAPGELPRPPLELPEANYLGIKIPMRYIHKPILDKKGHIIAFIDEAMEWEVGNFGVDESLPADGRSTVMSEVWIQIMRFAFSQSPQMNFVGTTLHAYADEKSLKLYLPWGFDYLREYELDGQLVRYGADEIPKPIKKIGSDGTVINWWPIVWYPERMLEFNNKVSESGFRGFNPERLRIRREELSQAPGAEADRQAGFSVLLKNIEGGDDRIAQASMSAMTQLFAAVEVYNDNLNASCPMMDYGSDFKNDPMMFGYKTYCDTTMPIILITEQITEVVLPYFQRLATGYAGPLAKRRAQKLLKEIGKVKFFQRYVKAKPVWATYPVSDPLAERFTTIESSLISKNVAFSLNEHMQNELVNAALQMVREMKSRRFTALVLSGESAILSYSLLKAAWSAVEGEVEFPPVFLMGPKMNDYLKSLDHLPNENEARAWTDNEMPLLRNNGGKVLVLDDHANTGIKYVRQTDFYYKAGLLSVTYGFMATHPNSIAKRNSVLTYESQDLVQQFQQVGELLHSNKTAANRLIATLVQAIRERLANCRYVLNPKVAAKTRAARR